MGRGCEAGVKVAKPVGWHVQPAVRERTTANNRDLGATLNEPCRAVVEATVTWRAHLEYSTSS